MSSLTPDNFEEAISFLKTLAEPNRFRIFAELMRGDSCNCELKDNLGLPPSLLSHHLRVLSESGLVNSRRDNVDGRWIYYTVDRETAAYWREWFNELLDPNLIMERPVCGPEGQIAAESIGRIETAEIELK